MSRGTITITDAVPGGQSDAWTVLQKSLRKFSYDRPLAAPILIATIRKAGTHLVRNVAAHFVGPQRTHWEFVGPSGLVKNYETFASQPPALYVGHVNRNWAANFLFRDAKVVLVVRDPFTQVISKAMRFFAPRLKDPLTVALREKDAPFDEAIYYAIHGATFKGWEYPSVATEYHDVAMAWLDRADVVLRHEDITRPGAEAAFNVMLRRLGWADIPDAAARVRAGMAPEASSSFSLKRDRAALSPAQRQQIELLIPGVRKILGYESQPAETPIQVPTREERAMAGFALDREGELLKR